MIDEIKIAQGNLHKLVRAEKLRENSRRNSAKLRGVSPRKFAQILRENARRRLRKVYRETLMNLNYFNVNYSVF